MMSTWPAPAKLNLFLHITGRRADGYHTLQTVFQFLDYADELSFTLNKTGEIKRGYALPNVPEEHDLCLRAAHLLQSAAGINKGVEIHLQKRIPLGAGLGGGSSDAATTLLALNHLWGLSWSLTQLAELGLKLGADVPVFVQGQAAWAEGVGEILTQITLTPAWYVVIVPPVFVPTARVFADPELTRATSPITIRDFHAGLGHNDLAPVARRRYPQVDNALKSLEKYGEAKMTGSGACVFLQVPSAAVGAAILSAITNSGGYTGFVAQGVNIHPLHARLSEISNWGVAKR